MLVALNNSTKRKQEASDPKAIMDKISRTIAVNGRKSIAKQRIVASKPPGNPKKNLNPNCQAAKVKCMKEYSQVTFIIIHKLLDAQKLCK